MKIEIPDGITPTHIKDYSKSLLDQFSNPRNKGVDFDLAKQEANIPSNIPTSEITESEGFAFLAESIGLTDDFLLQALKDDITSKPANRVKELKLAFDLKGKLLTTTATAANENTAKAMDILKQVLKKPEPNIIIKEDGSSEF
jgi:hypothetical protein